MFTLHAGSLARAEITVKRSRFIATLMRTDTVDQARAAIADVKREFPDARHNCSAFVVSSQQGPNGAHSSDDGEPSGTAGPPILEVLLGDSLVDVTAVVTRYFGGILLGTGGLVRAYTEATQAGVAAADLVALRTLKKVEVQVPLKVAGRFESEIHSRGWHVLESSWSDTLSLTLGLTEIEADELSLLTAEMTRAPAQLRDLGTTVIEAPVSARSSSPTLGP